MLYIYILIFAFVFLVVLCSVLFYQSSKNKANGNEQFAINKKTLEYLQSSKFIVSKFSTLPIATHTTKKTHTKK